MPERRQVGMAELYRQMWHYAAGVRTRLVLSSVMLVGSQLLKLLVPLCAAKAIEAVQHADSGAGLSACLPWIAAIIATSVGVWLLHGPGRVIERSVAVRVRRALSDRLYRRLARAPLGWHERHHSAELAHRMAQASSALANFTQSQFIYLQSAVNVIGPLVALTILSAPTGLLGVIGLLFVAGTIVAFDRVLMRLANRENQAERRHAAAVLDCLTNISTVLALRLGEPTRRLVARRLADAAAPLERSITLNEWKWCAVDLMSVSLGWALVVAYACRTEAKGAVLIGGVFMVHQYAQQACGVIGSLASNLQTFARIRTDYASADPIWNAPSRRGAVPRLVPPVSGDAGAAAPVGNGDWRVIDLCGLHFEHPLPSADRRAPRAGGRRASDAARADRGGGASSGARPMHATAVGTPAAGSAATERRGGLREISLRLHAGERIALVGPSGSGKSTLLRLLAGLYAPTRGHVEIDGIAHLGLRDLEAAATLIPQEAQLFEATVRENIAFDLPCTEAEIAAAVHTGSFDEVLGLLPAGLETAVTQGGFNLSGGQRQRLCLARGILAARHSSVLLLDEPTSALDPLAEQRVYERLAARFPHACLIASVHRMSLLAHFDRVVLMAAGEVVDIGTVDELRARQPLFREMAGALPAVTPMAA